MSVEAVRVASTVESQPMPSSMFRPNWAAWLWAARTRIESAVPVGSSDGVVIFLRRVAVSCSFASSAALDCRLSWEFAILVWLVTRATMTYLPTSPVRLMRVSSISSTALMTRAAPW